MGVVAARGWKASTAALAKETGKRRKGWIKEGVSLKGQINEWIVRKFHHQKESRCRLIYQTHLGLEAETETRSGTNPCIEAGRVVAGNVGQVGHILR